MRGEHTQPRQRFAGAIGKREGGVLGEGHDPAIGGARLETEAVRDRRRHQDGGRRGERQLRRFVGHLAAAALDQENLKQIAVPMRADGPVVNRGARGDRFDMNEIERLIVRRIAVKMKQGQRGWPCAKHRPIAPKKKPPLHGPAAFYTKKRQPADRRAAAL